MKPEGASSGPQAAPRRKQAERLAGTAAEHAAIELSLREVTQALVAMLPAAEVTGAAREPPGADLDASTHLPARRRSDQKL